MNLKTYKASTIADALAQVKQDLGKDAVILHTRSFKSGGLFGLGARKMYEVTASINIRTAPAPKRQPNRTDQRRAEGAPAGADASSDHRLATTLAVARAYGAGAAGRRSADALAPAASHAATGASTSPLVTPARLAPVSPGASADLEAELASIKSMVARVLSTSANARCALMPDALQAMYLRLLEAEVSSQIADEIIAAVRDDLSAAQACDAPAVRDATLRRLASYIPVCAESAAIARAADGRPFTVALVGPTGVGKTTTLAKLAATWKLRHGRRVGLITADTYRIAAVDQLRTYANIIGLPLHVASTPRDVAAACDALADYDCILIDTAGRSPSDTDRLDELRAFLGAARPHQTHLVLSSAASESGMLHAAERFRAVSPDRVIFTKLDEAVNFGVLVNVGRRVQAALSYITTGQEVPDTIEPGRADRIARLILSVEAPA